MIRTLTRSLYVFLFLIVFNVQASPPIGAIVQTWHYDPVTKQLSIHVVNVSNKDITCLSR